MESTDSEEEREKLRKEEEAARRARSNADISARKQARREYTTHNALRESEKSHIFTLHYAGIYCTDEQYAEVKIIKLLQTKITGPEINPSALVDIIVILAKLES